MGIQFNNSKQCAVACHFLQASIYKKVSSAHQNSGLIKGGLIRLSGPLIAVTSSLITLAKRVGSVGETIFKSLINILFFPFFDCCEFSAGLSQLVTKLPMDLVALAFVPLEIAIGSVVTTFAILLKPQEYSEFRKTCHQDVAEGYENANDGDNLANYSELATALFP